VQCPDHMAGDAAVFPSRPRRSTARGACARQRRRAQRLRPASRAGKRQDGTSPCGSSISPGRRQLHPNSAMRCCSAAIRCSSSLICCLICLISSRSFGSLGLSPSRAARRAAISSRLRAISERIWAHSAGSGIATLIATIVIAAEQGRHAAGSRRSRPLHRFRSCRFVSSGSTLKRKYLIGFRANSGAGVQRHLAGA
jgi:hypothetical protein